ncbi:MAG: hypothetical protein WC911_01805 [Thermoleophilia bacterium]
MKAEDLAQEQVRVRREAWAALHPVVGDVPSLECAFLVVPALAAPWEARLDRIRWAMVSTVDRVVFEVCREMARKFEVQREDIRSPALLGCYIAAMKIDYTRQNASYETLCFWWARRMAREHIREASHPCKTSRRTPVRVVPQVDAHDPKSGRKLAAPNDRPDHRLEVLDGHKTREKGIRIQLDTYPKMTRRAIERLMEGATFAEVASELRLSCRRVQDLLAEVME